MNVLAWWRCYWRGHHEAERYPLGGYRCACGHVGESLDEMGFIGAGWVHPVRKVYVRQDGGTTKTSAWEPGPRGW